MSRKKVKKVVKYDGDVALEYQQDEQDAGMSLVGIRRLLPEMPPDISGLKEIDIVSFNREAERLFVEMLTEMIGRSGPVPVRVVRSSLAFRIGVSTETVKRYLEKYSAPIEGAPFSVVDGSVVLARVEGNDGSGGKRDKVKRVEGKYSKIRIPRKRRKHEAGKGVV